MNVSVKWHSTSDLLLIGPQRLSNFAVLLAWELQLTQSPAPSSSIGLCGLDSKIAFFSSKGHREVATKLSNDIPVSLTMSLDFGIHRALRLVAISILLLEWNASASIRPSSTLHSLHCPDSKFSDSPLVIYVSFIDPSPLQYVLRRWMVVSISRSNIIVLRSPNSPLTRTTRSNMTIISNDPRWWLWISLAREYSYFTGSLRWRTSNLTQSWRWFRSCILHYSGIWLGWARKCLLRVSVLTSLLYSPALTFGQEVGRCDYWESHLTENATIVWTDLGEQTRSHNCWIMHLILGKRQHWSLITVLYLSVRSVWLYKCSFRMR